MMYEWYNNGQVNKKVNLGDEPPEGFIKGYKLKNNMKKLRELTRIYEIRVENARIKYNEKFEKEKEKLEKELLIRQKLLTPF